MNEKLIVHIQKARDGSDYVQIMSSDQVSINIVLIADVIELKDSRSLPDTSKQS